MAGITGPGQPLGAANRAQPPFEAPQDRFGPPGRPLSQQGAGGYVTNAEKGTSPEMTLLPTHAEPRVVTLSGKRSNHPKRTTQKVVPYMKRFLQNTFVLLAVTSLVAVPTVSYAHSSHSPKHAHGAIIGVASWYGPGFDGRRTANGERYDMLGLTAAHKTLPFGTKVRVTNLQNGNSVIVRINDRGPYIGRRLIDLSKTAAIKIGLLSTGTAMVALDIVG